MRPADAYRKLAAEPHAKARRQTGYLATQLEALAKAYTRLAEQADRNSFQDLWFEYGPNTRLDSEGEGA
jgi:hypothetical protein